MKNEILVLGVLLTASCVHAQTVLLSDTFDSDVSSWTQEPDIPAVTLEWDGGMGSPLPGSLRMATNVNLAETVFVEAITPCFPVTSGELIQAQAMIFANFGGLPGVCFVAPIFYVGPNCTGDRTFSGNVPGNMMNVWELDQTSMSVPPPIQSLRLGLAMSVGPGSGDASCHFDSASLTTDRASSLAEVPALSEVGLLLMILALGSLAIRLLSTGRQSA